MRRGDRWGMFNALALLQRQWESLSGKKKFYPLQDIFAPGPEAETKEFNYFLLRPQKKRCAKRKKHDKKTYKPSIPTKLICLLFYIFILFIFFNKL